MNWAIFMVMIKVRGLSVDGGYVVFYCFLNLCCHGADLFWNVKFAVTQCSNVFYGSIKTCRVVVLCDAEGDIHHSVIFHYHFIYEGGIV